MYGTLIYMAPEHIRGVPSLQSDQYALAVIMYEWLSGQPPFQGAVAEVVSQHLFATPTLLREQDAQVPLAVERVVLKALSKDPKLRFVDVLSLATALREVVLQKLSGKHDARAVPLVVGLRPPLQTGGRRR